MPQQTFQQRVNGTVVGSSQSKDAAIRAARKAALNLSKEERRGVVHVEVYQLDDDSIENIHRDMILLEDLKELETDLLKPVGLVVFTKHVESKTKTSHDDRPLFNEGDYVILDGELHKIVTVTDSRALAQPVMKKHVTIKDKFADGEKQKSRKFAIRRKPIQISPIAQGVLSAKEVKQKLKEIEELENEQLNKSSEDGSTSSESQPADVGESG